MALAASSDAARRTARELRESNDRARRQEWWNSLSFSEQEAYRAQQRGIAAARDLVDRSTHNVADIHPGDKISFFSLLDGELVSGDVEWVQ